ncbi:MAG: molybdopterin-dependent oxidoreductase [Terriglobales bacterium]|jgi:hypothetical protein
MTQYPARVTERPRHYRPITFFHVAVLFILTSVLGAASAAAQTLTVVDAAGHSSNISAAQIASISHVSVSAEDHGVASKFDGVPLSAVLQLANVQLGDSLHGTRLSEVLLISAADGYRVAFALAEIDPAFAVREIILADRRDGKPLDSREGPFRIVAPGDKRPARWIRQVTELKVVAVK